MQITNSTPAFKGAFYVNLFAKHKKFPTTETAAEKVYDIFNEAKARVILTGAGSLDNVQESTVRNSPEAWYIKAVVPDEKDVEVLGELKEVSGAVNYTSLINDRSMDEKLESALKRYPAFDLYGGMYTKGETALPE